ncbi:MAG: ImmA/IrrE family metallo-endopeptidase [Erysipelotrichales bacterium]|nr:ImmA/IrrE family metallo-endopeptidase [Erysipelotrichales bacterium]
MEPEIRIARRVITKNDLVHPFNIYAFAKNVVYVEEDLLPSHVDGIVLDSNKEKPTVILNADSSESRKIFTLAHEIGHYYIPWHMLNFICHTEYENRTGSSFYWFTEGEANRFAAELLMPQEWIKRIISEKISLPAIVSEVCKMRVSSTAACLSICKALPAGFLFVETDHNDKVVYSSRSEGTIASPLRRGSIFNKKLFEYTGCEIIPIQNGFTKVFWLRFTDLQITLGIGKDIENEIDSKLMIKNFLESLKTNHDIKMSMLRSVNGVIGAANTMHHSSDFEAIYQTLSQRFASNRDLAYLLDFEQFRKFLLKKAYELSKKNKFLKK